VCPADRSAPARTPPRARGVPGLGLLRELRADPLGLVTRLRRDFGPVVRFELGVRPCTLVADPEAVKESLVDHVRHYDKHTVAYEQLRLVLGDGLLISEGDMWLRQRRIAQPAFHRARIAAFGAQMVTTTDALVRGWEARRGEVIALDDAMMRLTLRIVGKALLDTDVASDADVVGEAVTIAAAYVDDRLTRLFPPPPRWPTPANLRFRRAVAQLDQIVQGIVQERRQTAEDRGDLLSLFMATVDPQTGERMSDRQLRDEVMTMFLAGHETTANALMWTFVLLSSHPDVRERARAEVLAAVGPRLPTVEDLPRLGYVRRVFDEAMRLYPPAWMWSRRALQDDTLGGWAIPKGSWIFVPPWVLHRDARYWPNPEGFDPDRFLPEHEATRPRYAYAPFGGGPRQCIGNGFATMEGTLVLATILPRVQLDLVPGQTIAPTPRVTLRPSTSVAMRVSPPPA